MAVGERKEGEGGRRGKEREVDRQAVDDEGTRKGETSDGCGSGDESGDLSQDVGNGNIWHNGCACMRACVACARVWHARTLGCLGARGVP